MDMTYEFHGVVLDKHENGGLPEVDRVVTFRVTVNDNGLVYLRLSDDQNNFGAMLSNDVALKLRDIFATIPLRPT